MQRVTDLVFSVLACAAAFLLSWPFKREFAYWATSHTAWWIYFICGSALSMYVFYAFIGSLHILFLHAAEEEDVTSVQDNREDAPSTAEERGRP